MISSFLDQNIIAITITLLIAGSLFVVVLAINLSKAEDVATAKKLKKRIAALDSAGTADTAAVAEWHDKFVQEVGSDLNTSMGITLVYDVLKADISDAVKRAVLEDYDRVLSLDLLKEDKEAEGAGASDELTAYIESKIAERKEAKAAKDFARADAIRDELLAKGVAIKDTREGTVWELV